MSKSASFVRSAAGRILLQDPWHRGDVCEWADIQAYRAASESLFVASATNKACHPSGWLPPPAGGWVPFSKAVGDGHRRVCVFRWAFGPAVRVFAASFMDNTALMRSLCVNVPYINGFSRSFMRRSAKP